LAFSKLSGLSVDRQLRKNGDKGIDFMIPFGNSTKLVSLDVKGARKALHLLVKDYEIQRCADILVLASVNGNIVSLLGWEHKCVMERMPKRRFGYELLNYYRRFELLRPMCQLTGMMKMGNEIIEKERYDEAVKQAATELRAKRLKIAG